MTLSRCAVESDNVCDSDKRFPFDLDRPGLGPGHFDARCRVEVLVTALEQPTRSAPVGCVGGIGDGADVLGEVLGRRLRTLEVEKTLLLGVADVGRVDVRELLLADTEPHAKDTRRNPDAPCCDLHGRALTEVLGELVDEVLVDHPAAPGTPGLLPRARRHITP